ncbi:uncharacterized protein LOC119186654 isoform X3 [Rhipicephalus microplus]|uniref:uncharacterized protein LOC119186654 isoform X3 n=1 Tax=Rhipicephalus microplus TaxID=6941 RepID=UPI003F6D3E7C
MEADEEQGSTISEPQEQSEGSSSDQSNADDDEWRPCRRKVVRRVNLQRSQATKLMWQRKRAAAAALLLQQQQQHEGNNPGLMGPSGSGGSIGSSPTLDRQTASMRQSMKALPMSAVSKCKPAAAQQQPPPTRRRRFPAKAAGSPSSGSRANGGRGRTKRMQSLNMSWQQRKLARLRLARLKARDPLSRAIFRRDSVRFSMCWSDTTLGSSLAGKPSLKPKEESLDQKTASLVGLKAYRHINPPSAARSAEMVQELQTDDIMFSGAKVRPYLERACRPKLFQKDESSGSEDPEEDECESAAIDQAEKISNSDTDESVEELPPERPTLRPKLLQTSRSYPISLPDLDKARKRDLSNSVPSLCSPFVAPAFALPAKLRWKLNPVEYQEYIMPAKLRHKQDRLLSSVAKGKDIDTTDKNEPGTSRCSIVDPVVAGVKAEHKEPPSERRSRAKRLWWEQVKQLDLRLSSGGAGSAISEESVEDLLSSMPKFLLAELFPDPTSTRKQTKKASRQQSGPAKTSVVPSRRSLIMKENWRKRKEAWLSAAAQTLAAASRPVCASGSNPPSPSTEQREESGPTEDSSQYLARSMALLRCRQYRHDMIAQMDLQQRTRPHRHYNARGIHIASNKDACDCLQPNCPGCHFPCPKCNSQKCGDECRSNRNYVYEQIEVDGYTNAVFTNSLLA